MGAVHIPWLKGIGQSKSWRLKKFFSIYFIVIKWAWIPFYRKLDLYGKEFYPRFTADEKHWLNAERGKFLLTPMSEKKCGPVFSNLKQLGSRISGRDYLGKAEEETSTSVSLQFMRKRCEKINHSHSIHLYNWNSLLGSKTDEFICHKDFGL